MNKNRNYALLLASQFLSAFGDNVILMVILGPLLKMLKEGKISAEQQSLDNIFYTSLLFVPYVLFAPFAGYLNDRFSKNQGLLVGNLFKLIGTALAVLSIWANGPWQALGYFIVGIGACLYSPAKYGILPEILPRERLVKANGTVELLTLVAILSGNIVGATMVDHMPRLASYGLVALNYLASMTLNVFMTRTPAHPEVQLRESVAEFKVNVSRLFQNRRLLRILVGTGLFWICGAMIKMNFQPWGQRVLQLETMTQISLLGLWLSIGVMIGSVLAGQLYGVGDLHASRRYGWLLALSIGVLGALDFILSHGLNYPRLLSLAVLIIAGVFAGLFLIPLNAALQAESHQGSLGKTIATQNGIENAAMLAGSAFAYANVKVGFDPSQLFFGLALLAAIVACWLRFPVVKNVPNESLAPQSH